MRYIRELDSHIETNVLHVVHYEMHMAYGCMIDAMCNDDIEFYTRSKLRHDVFRACYIALRKSRDVLTTFDAHIAVIEYAAYYEHLE